jgi:predicted N-acetyltransferase YhbS
VLEIRNVTAAERAAFLALIDTELRPPGATTSALDDFPIALGLGNRSGQYVAVDDGEVVGCLACLIRPFVTSAGVIDVAGIGSVVTAKHRRGEGLSARLQTHAMRRIRAAGVPLVVLWSERPELYARRGFRAAGVEYHVDLERCELGEFAANEGPIRPFETGDIPTIATLYQQHALRTERALAETASLYRMPGTQGLVYAPEPDVRAYIFCGKGADFPGYVCEFGGDPGAVAALLARARTLGYASHVLVPQGATALLTLLADRRARWSARPSGLWAVAAADRLPATTTAATEIATGDPAAADPRVWLGHVDETGCAHPGAFDVAVWGFDSV